MNDTCFVLEWNSSSHLARAKRHEFLITEDPPNLDGDQHTVFPETYNNPKSSWKSTFVTQPAGCSVGLDRCFERRECVRRMAKARDGMDSGPAHGSTRIDKSGSLTLRQVLKSRLWVRLRVFKTRYASSLEIRGLESPGR